MVPSLRAKRCEPRQVSPESDRSSLDRLVTLSPGEPGPSLAGRANQVGDGQDTAGRKLACHVAEQAPLGAVFQMVYREAGDDRSRGFTEPPPVRVTEVEPANLDSIVVALGPALSGLQHRVRRIQREQTDLIQPFQNCLAEPSVAAAKLID